MKNILLTIFFVSLFCISIKSQSKINSMKQENNSIKINDKDSIIEKGNIQIINESGLNKSNFYLHDIETVKMMTRLQLEYSVNNMNFNNFNNIMLPLQEQYIESQKLNFVQYFLGITQTAAVGYLAYRHIKKYGFWN